MEKKQNTIELSRTPQGTYKATRESLSLINRQTKNILKFKLISDNEHRSIAQHNDYWGFWLPTFCSHVDGMTSYLTEDSSGKIKFNQAHRFLTLKWAIEKNRIDLVEVILCLVGNKIEKVSTVSLSFASCSQKDAQDYFDWVHSTFFKCVGVTIEEANKNDLAAC